MEELHLKEVAVHLLRPTERETAKGDDGRAVVGDLYVDRLAPERDRARAEITSRLGRG